MDKKPNIVIFNPDQFRADAMSHLENKAAHTPNLDNMILKDGLSFRNAFCQNPVCTPSRCSFMSGWYPHVRGHRTLYHMMQKDEPVLLKTLKNAGYHVVWVGKNDLVPAENGFSDYCDERPWNPRKTIRKDIYEDNSWRGSPENSNYYSFFAGELNTDEDGEYFDGDLAHIESVLDFLDRYDNDKPFCVFISLGIPHPPYAVEKKFKDLIDISKLPDRIKAPEDWSDKPSILKGIYDRQGLSGLNEDFWDELRATYLAMCSKTDYLFGEIVNKLIEKSLYDDTAIFFFSDHGDFTGDYGLVEKTQNTFEDCLTNVPLIIKTPNWIKLNPGVSDALVELVDIVATIHDLAGISPGYTNFGKTLLDVISGEKFEHRDAIFSEGGRNEGETHCMELESKAANNPENLYWPRLSLQAEEGPWHTKAVMCRTKKFKYVKRLYEQDELYDLKSDPFELNNLITDIKYEYIKLKLSERTLEFLLETTDVVPLKPNRRE